MSSAADRYRRWFAYEQDSHAKMLAALAAVTEELREREAYRQAVTLMAHIVAARRLWLARFGLTANVTADFAPQQLADLFPENIALAEVVAHEDETQARWASFLVGLTDIKV